MPLLFVLLLAAGPLVNWNYRTARMEGAAGDLKSAAAALRQTAEGIASAGRLKDVAVLRSQADALHQKVMSATLAAQVLDQFEGTAGLGVEAGVEGGVEGGVEAPSTPSTPPVEESSPASSGVSEPN